MFRNQYDTDVTVWSPEGRLLQVCSLYFGSRSCRYFQRGVWWGVGAQDVSAYLCYPTETYFLFLYCRLNMLWNLSSKEVPAWDFEATHMLFWEL